MASADHNFINSLFDYTFLVIAIPNLRVYAETPVIYEFRKAVLAKHGRLYGVLSEEATRALQAHIKVLEKEIAAKNAAEKEAST